VKEAVECGEGAPAFPVLFLWEWEVPATACSVECPGGDTATLVASASLVCESLALVGGPEGNVLPPFFSTTHKIQQQKKTEKRDGPRTDQSTISAKPHFNELLLPTPFLKELNSFCKDIANSGNITV
jgi:hypothetical protein